MRKQQQKNFFCLFWVFFGFVGVFFGEGQLMVYLNTFWYHETWPVSWTACVHALAAVKRHLCPLRIQITENKLLPPFWFWQYCEIFVTHHSWFYRISVNCGLYWCFQP